MNRDKQIEEMVKDLDEIYSTDFIGDYAGGLRNIAEQLVDKGYRKAPEVIEDLFEEFEALVTQKDMPITTMALLATKEYADFKKKLAKL